MNYHSYLVINSHIHDLYLLTISATRRISESFRKDNSDLNFKYHINRSYLTFNIAVDIYTILKATWGAIFIEIFLYENVIFY